MSTDSTGTDGTSRGDTGSHPLGELLEAALHDGKAYFHARQEQVKLDVYGKTGAVAGNLLVLLISAVASTLFLVFASLALAVWLGTVMGGLALGLTIVGGAYLLVFLLVFFLARNRIQESVQLHVINLLRDGES